MLFGYLCDREMYRLHKSSVDADTQMIRECRDVDCKVTMLLAGNRRNRGFPRTLTTTSFPGLSQAGEGKRLTLFPRHRLSALLPLTSLMQTGNGNSSTEI
jgi:hypothetical protein